MVQPTQVEIELERDGNEVTISARQNGANFVLCLRVDGASVLSAALHNAAGDDAHRIHRFELKSAKLGTSR